MFLCCYFFCEPAPFPVDVLCQLSALHSSTAFPSSDLWENVLWPVIDSALPAPLLSIAVKVPVICRKPVSTALSTLSFPLCAAHTMCIRITVTSSRHSVFTHIFTSLVLLASLTWDTFLFCFIFLRFLIFHVFICMILKCLWDTKTREPITITGTTRKLEYQVKVVLL